MQSFDNLEDAFKFFIRYVYPILTPEQKKAAEGAKRNYIYKNSLSERKIKEILENSGFEIKMEITYTPKYDLDDLQ